VQGQKNVKELALIDPRNVWLPSLHVKLGLFKNFVKALNFGSSSFKHLQMKFPKLSDAKIKQGIFIGPQIRYIMDDLHFESLLNETEFAAWYSFIDVVKNILGTRASDNSVHLVERMADYFRKMGCNMSIKLHLLHWHLEFFVSNMAAVTDEHGEWFHQEISSIGRRYKGKIIPSMLADYCWNSVRETTDNKRANFKKTWFCNP